MATGLAEAGASVVVASSSSLPRAESVAGALPCVANARHHAVVLDQMDESSCKTGFAAAVERAGKLDILVNNGLEIAQGDLTSVTHDQFARHQANNAGYFTLARQLRDHVVSTGRAGNVIMIGSMYGQVGSYPDTYDGICSASSVAYHALKGGIDSHDAALGRLLGQG